MKLFTIIVFIFSFSLVYAKEYKDDFTHTFQVEKGTTVYLKNGDGNVTVRTWDKNEIKVDVVYHINSKSSREDDNEEFDVEFRQNGDRVYIIGHERRRSTFGFFSIQYIDYRYELSVPPWVAFDIDGDDGDLTLENITGDIRIKNDDGDVFLKDINNAFSDIRIKDGDVNIKGLKGELSVKADDGTVTMENMQVSDGDVRASDGRIRIRDSKGNFYVDSDDGDISLINISGEKLEASTQDGDVDILFAGEGEVSLAINTNDGSVNVQFDKPISAQFSLETDDGRIRFDVDNADIFRESKRYVTGDIGEGSGRVKVRTNDGSITVSSAY